MTSNIPVAAANKRAEDSFKAKRGASESIQHALIQDIVEAVNVIMLIEFNNSMFQLSRCCPTFLCISILSHIASKIA
ncbi:hypothetical protein TSUD_380320 [Trifolium subterraneum]|uniref:Uncharacterized protein n=1 Tax=Trifolium subterraneum TaxID=3900 RepID=A0A2Z6NTV6_TRISU|nr:hypothetical protein TSUD_380320 [Trifolium subterraneum]